jgi:DNA repair exonuclease SbcCD nuclease subunit
VWARTAWPGNVHIFTDDRLEPYELPGATVWGAAFTARQCSSSCLEGWRAPEDGRQLLLLHGALTGEQWADEPAHRPLTRAGLEACGAAFAMLGHFHQGRADDLLCYPGSPEPLTFGERDGNHGAAVLEITDAGVACELVSLARRAYAAETLRVDGAASADQVEAAVEAAVARHPGSSLELTLEGEIDPGCEISAASLEERCGAGLEELRVRDRTLPAYDLAAISREPSVRGRFVARLMESPDPHAREALLAGLRAMDGRRELVA